MPNSNPSRIFVTGASSGIGKALVLHYARPGTTLGLTARREAMLSQVQEECEAKGASVQRYAVDAADDRAMAGCAENFMKIAGSVDLVIANAGTSMDGHKRHVYHDTEQLNRLIRVNLCGVINTLAPFLKHAVETKHPAHFAAVSSVAAFRGLPGGSYSASKAGVKAMMESWRIVFHGTGMHFTTIYPGYVKSEMTDRDAFAPSNRLSAEKSAALIARALRRKKKNYVFPFWYRPIVFLMPRVPDLFLWLGTRSGMED